MNERNRIRGIVLAVALSLGAGGMTASAHPHDVDYVEVPSETSPIGPQTVLDANRTSSALKLSPSDTANALHITLPAARAPQHVSQPSSPLQVAFHRDMPKEYLDDLSPKLNWIALGDGAIASPVSVTSPGATNMRMGFLVDLPPGGEIRFFGADNQRLYPMITQEDIEWKGDKPLIRWSPVVEGDIIGAEIVLPSKEALSSFSFEIDRISHGYGMQGGFGYSPALQCSNHIDVKCRSGSFPENLQSAVGRIRFDNASGGGVCSGTLVSDRDRNSFVPYFLTAHHCIPDRSVAATITTRWFFHGSCASTVFPRLYIETNYGTDLLATSPAQDSTLLRYRRLLPTGLAFGSSQRFSYAGWSTMEVGNSTDVYGLHHPGGGVMKYSAGRKIGNEDFELVGTDIRVRNGMVVDWSTGTIEPGSSGSGLFRLGTGGHLVGVASGTETKASCLTATAGYGAFRDFYSHTHHWLGATTAPVVPPPTHDDHGDWRWTSTEVSIPSTTAGNLDYGGDADYFGITVRQQRQLRAFTTGGTDTYGELRDHNGRLIASNDDSGGGNNFDLTGEVQPQPEPYNILVRGTSRAEIGPYSLTVLFVDSDDRGNTQDASTLVSIPSTTAGNLEYNEDVDYFHIDVGGTDRIQVHTTGSTDTYGTLFRGETLVTENDDGGSGTNFSFTEDVQPGTYYIAVRGFGGTTTGPYSLRVEYPEIAHTLPFVTAAGNQTQRSVVRIVNNSNRAGKVTVHAIDDTGMRFGPVALWHNAMRARHFTSQRLENGAGMIGGTGVGDGEGNWWLEVSSTLNITPLAYIRGASGIETTMHDVVRTFAGRQHVVNFHKAPDNPGTASYSLLRLVNPIDSSASVTISGRDDLGTPAAGGEVRLSLPAGGARMLTSTELENGGSDLKGGLGSAGRGRWRLTISADRPVWVMNLMFNPRDGYITNVSSVRMEP